MELNSKTKYLGKTFARCIQLLIRHEQICWPDRHITITYCTYLILVFYLFFFKVSFLKHFETVGGSLTASEDRVTDHADPQQYLEKKTKSAGNQISAINQHQPVIKNQAVSKHQLATKTQNLNAPATGHELYSFSILLLASRTR